MDRIVRHWAPKHANKSRPTWMVLGEVVIGRRGWFFMWGELSCIRLSGCRGLGVLAIPFSLVGGFVDSGIPGGYIFLFFNTYFSLL